MRIATAVLALAATLLPTGCEEKKAEGEAPSRFASVKRDGAAKAASTFCEKQWPTGEGGKRFTAPAERPIPGTVAAAAAKAGAWRWVNLWATWCQPCIEEMGLLARWRDSLTADGVNIDFELWSIDDEESALTGWLAKTKLPGRARWLRAQGDLAPFLEGIGADAASAIPIHALVDGNGNLRCLRVGAVHDEDYGAVKAFLTGA
ncbi:MAG: hypothetical protein A2138_05210 [Deltaproteobacteria bacterium RBG_16_71_12]|nr:MAG: hypothetical protein A2138_05210 [Deltaproteobacteria bacterium RBG_16_71_12]